MITKRTPIAALVAALMGLTLGVAALPAATASGTGEPPLAWASPRGYVAVIDAGSSGTRLALFESSTGLEVTQIYSAPIKTAGLSSFAKNPTDAGPDAVQPLLEQLTAHLTEQSIARADVAVALLATAGMRRLKLVDPVATQAIFASTRATLDASGYRMRANKILPDAQEALLAWLDANAGAGTLDDPAQDIGIVEVGGASAQVAFRSPRRSGPGIATVAVAGKRISVVAISYLGLGANEARGFMQVATEGNGALCFPRNESGTDPVDYLATSPLPVNSARADFRGAFCRRAFAGVIQDVAVDYSRDVRPRNLRDLPGFTGSFVGLGGIPATYADLDIPADADDRVALERAARATCKGEDAWEKVRHLFPTPTPVFAETLCSTSSYLAEFLFGTYGVGLDPATFDAQPDLPGGEPSWSKGYAITVLHP